MIITKAKITNFKSIEDIEISFDKIGDSYTKIFVGINESGKSNILEALSYFEPPKQNVTYDHYCNQKLEDGKDCDLQFYMEFDKDEKDALVKKINSIANTNLNIDISDQIFKYVYLRPDNARFRVFYLYDININNQNLYIKAPNYRGDAVAIVNEENKTTNCEKLNNENFKKHFGDFITDFIKRNEPNVFIWKPINKDLLYNINLMDFKNNLSANKPLYNIFKLSGYKDGKAINSIIDKVANPKSRSRLIGRLNDSLNNYIAKVWENQIDFVIDITETGNFTLFIKDKGQENIYDRFSISDRSQGAQHFLSLILSLSLSAKNQEKRNDLIIIDEPEAHLHPSGARNLAHELLIIGQENYVFIATHSPFMIDKCHKERHCIVKKNNKAITELKWIKDSDNLIDDEVLRDAFGIDVYKDLLNPHSVLVEGSTDKLLLKKTLNCLNHSNVGITNGCGSNITTLVSKLNFDNMKVVVVLDDDEDGRRDKEKILQVGGLYTAENVFTIRELVQEIVDDGTIEDTLEPAFVKSQFEKLYKAKFKKDIDFQIQSNKPILLQITELLNREGVYSKWDMDAFKKQLSEEFNPSKTSLSTKHILLEKLAKNIIEKLK